MEQEGTKADAIGAVVRAFVPWTLEAAVRKLEDTERNMAQTRVRMHELRTASL